MIYLVAILLLVIVGQFRYIMRLRKEIHAHTDTWMKIENLTDHNKDGDVVIHCRHTEDK